MAVVAVVVAKGAGSTAEAEGDCRWGVVGGTQRGTNMIDLVRHSCGGGICAFVVCVPAAADLLCVECTGSSS